MVPMWMNGTHPSVADGMVGRFACSYHGHGTGTSPCCDEWVKIGVINCGGYYVYYLHPPRSCPMSYCAGQLEVTASVAEWLLRPVGLMIMMIIIIVMM